MAQTTQLRAGQTGYVRPDQVWVHRDPANHVTRLFVEPSFVDQASATSGMLRVEAMNSQARPGTAYYRIYLPLTDSWRRLRRHVTVEQAQQRGLVEVPMVVSTSTGKPDFPTIPGFFFVD